MSGGNKNIFGVTSRAGCPKRRELGGARWGLGEKQERGVGGGPQGFGGAVRGAEGSLAGSWHTGLLGCLSPSPHNSKAAVGATAGCWPTQLLARRVCHVESSGLAACMVPLRRQSVVGATLVTSMRHPNDSQRGGQAGNAFCFPLGKPGLLPVPVGSQGVALTSSRSSYWSMMLFSFSASSVFSWQSFMFLSLCCSIWAWISLSVPWK